jgi:hypothetical protein
MAGTRDISDSGQIVGAAYSSTFAETRGFSMVGPSGGAVELLDPLAGGAYSLATAVNNVGEIVGRSDLGGIPKAAFWAAGSPTAVHLETSGGPDANAYPLDINDQAQIAGFFTSSGSGNVNSWTAVRWTRDDRGRFDETKLPVPTPPPPSVFNAAYGINQAGYVAGTGSTLQPDVFETALRWTPTNGVDELDAVPGVAFPRFQAEAINDNLVAVGWGVNNIGVSTPVRWAADGSAVNLGQPAAFTSTQPIDVNNDGTIIANASRAPQDTDPEAMLNVGGVWMQLRQRLVNPGGWTLAHAAAINNLGQIVGSGIFNGASAGFVLTPAPATRPGDFDFDGDVDGRDFLVWQREFGAATSSPADANDDGLVNDLDLAVWTANLGPSPGGDQASTPEPAALTLWLVAAAVALRIQKRSRWRPRAALGG